MNIRPTICVAFVAAVIGFATGDGFGESVPGGCYLWTWQGAEKTLGEYNGCTACTSDQQHGNGQCLNQTFEEGQGTECYTTSQQDTYYVRHMNGNPCYSCTQTLTPYSYLVAHEGTHC